MKDLLTIGAVLAFSVSSTGFARDYPVITLQAGAIICFDYDDWKDMVAASIDQDPTAAGGKMALA